jgi:hypothetical protein
MSRPVRTALLACALAAVCPAVADAGMPSITLTDVARMRVQTISFFLVLLLLSSLCVQLLWNRLRRDFTSLPRLTYGKALGVVVLWGLLFVLVLTMISGARELMTPGAWEKQGLTYRLTDKPATAPAADDSYEQERRERLETLRGVLQQYARAHDGRYPPGTADAGIADELWVAPDASHRRYHYVPGLAVGGEAAPLVYEPATYGDSRFVLLTDGSIKRMTLDEILAALPEGK